MRAHSHRRGVCLVAALLLCWLLTSCSSLYPRQEQVEDLPELSSIPGVIRATRTVSPAGEAGSAVTVNLDIAPERLSSFPEIAREVAAKLAGSVPDTAFVELHTTRTDRPGVGKGTDATGGEKQLHLGFGLRQAGESDRIRQLTSELTRELDLGAVSAAGPLNGQCESSWGEVTSPVDFVGEAPLGVCLFLVRSGTSTSTTMSVSLITGAQFDVLATMPLAAWLELHPKALNLNAGGTGDLHDPGVFIDAGAGSRADQIQLDGAAARSARLSGGTFRLGFNKPAYCFLSVDDGEFASYDRGDQAVADEIIAAAG